MEILSKAPENYIQQCGCGAVLKYSKCDIHVAWKKYLHKDGLEYMATYDWIRCPSCDEMLKAEYEWFIEIEWVKNLLENIMK